MHAKPKAKNCLTTRISYPTIGSRLFCGYRIMAITPVFQTGDAGSIPATRSNSDFSTPMFSIVIPAKNEVAYIEKCIDSIKDCGDCKPERVIVVLDPCCIDGSMEVLQKRPVEILTAPASGTNSARQFGAMHAQSDIIAFLDADCQVTKQWAQRIVQEFNADNSLACLSGPYYYYELSRPKILLYELYLLTLSKVLMALFGQKVYGGNFVVRRSLWEKAGGFDTNYTFFGDDASIGKRLAKVGKVKFSNSFRVKSSGRHFNRDGFFLLGWKYVVEFVKNRL